MIDLIDKEEDHRQDDDEQESHASGKEAYDLAKADRIIMEGMGSQFDPGLESVYVNARPRLEEYYSKLQEA